MRKLIRSIGMTAVVMLAAMLVMLCANPAHAQATRTWVSGVGDDVNPCSRTAPCKTFAGAISKTAAGGEINCLDPGGFGTLTITKAISIICQRGQGSILASGTNGINVNAGAADNIYLEGLDINGAGTTLGLNGVNFLSGAAVHINNCVISNFSQTGISFAPTSNALMKVNNTTVTESAAGILIKPQGAFTAKAAIEHSHIDGNSGGGVRADGTGGGTVFASITDTSVSLNSSNAINAVANASGQTVNVSLMNDMISGNGLAGIQANGSNSGVAYALVGNSVIANNGTVTNAVGTGLIYSFTTNQILLPLGSGFTATPLK
jgi:parallel beta helix pectate lyase-like protein